MPKEWSDSCKKKAQRLLHDKGIAEISENMFQVKSTSKPDESYIIEDMKCHCIGFKNNHYCSHLLAVKLFKGVVKL